MVWKDVLTRWLGGPAPRRRRNGRRQDRADGISSDLPHHNVRPPQRTSAATSQTVPVRRPPSFRNLFAITNQVFENNVKTSSTRQEHELEMHPLLYTLTKRWAFPAVNIRIQTHPNEIHDMLSDEEGNNYLHWACFGRAPLETIEGFLSVCPELAKVQNVSKGLLPLHVACSFRASSEVIRALVNAYPDGAGIKTHRGGSTPLHLLCESGCSVDAVRAILETRAGRETVLQRDDRFHRTPLQMLHSRRNRAEFSRSIGKLQLELLRQELEQDEQDNNDLLTIDMSRVPPPLCEFWQKAEILVLAEYQMRCSSSSDAPLNLSDDLHVIHACFGIPNCPRSVIELALLLYSQQLLVADSDGRLPLHIAAAKVYARKDPLSKTANALLLGLIEACPEAAQYRDAQQLLPLQLLCKRSAWSESLAQLVMVYPLGLAAMDFDDRLYPHIWARFARRYDSHATHVLFEMMREKPYLFAHFRIRHLLV